MLGLLLLLLLLSGAFHERCLAGRLGGLCAIFSAFAGDSTTTFLVDLNRRTGEAVMHAADRPRVAVTPGREVGRPERAARVDHRSAVGVLGGRSRADARREGRAATAHDSRAGEDVR